MRNLQSLNNRGGDHHEDIIETLTRYLAKELGPRGITINVLAPGAIGTDFNNAAVRSNPQLNAFIASQTALGRAGQADDIGCIVACLCSGNAHWITGQRIEASGGMFCKKALPFLLSSRQKNECQN